MKKSNVTITDISNLCGVSRQTVSRVLNNSGPVKEETRKKVLEIIKKYGYKPNIYARNLAGKRRNINILLSVKANLGHSASIWLNVLINKIISMNKNKNVTLFIEQYYDKGDFETSLLNTTNSFVDGCIIFYEEENDDRIKILKRAGIPYIIYGKAYDENDVCVGIDNENSVIQATEYLFSKKMERILFISAFPTPVNLSRENAIKKAYIKNKKDINKLEIIKNVITHNQVYNITKKYYEEGKLPDVIFVSGDEKAIGALKAIYDLGIKIPQEISVMGIDNIPISALLSPSLSTIDFDYNEMALTILEKILNMIEGKEEKSQYFLGNIVVRGSTK